MLIFFITILGFVPFSFGAHTPVNMIIIWFKSNSNLNYILYSIFEVNKK
jgi:hypothetical protein